MDAQNTAVSGAFTMVAKTQTALPTMQPSPTATPPYPTASVVKANAVAFIERGNENNLSLWIANVDGSGERKLVGDIGKWSDRTNYFLRWSPDGKWISYISNDKMWIISPDGSEKKKVLSASDKSKRLISYNWHPDGLQIAYTQVGLRDGKFDSESVRILNLKTGETYDVSTHKPQPYGIIIRWTPNGQFLAFNKDASFIVFDAVNHKIKKEILTDSSCSALDNTASVWSPNSKWFFHFHGSGSSSFFWICLSGLDGSNYRIDIDGSTSRPVWDKTGNFLYFVMRKDNSNSNSSLDINQQLQRYNIKTKKTEFILSLGGQTYQYIWSVSVSPDGQTLETHTGISEEQISYVVTDLEFLKTKKITINSGCDWSADSKSFICVSQSNGYSTFHRLNIQTGESIVFSGEHKMVSWIISPIATTP